jgi:aspartyl-tRNA(Asn)/glutamyl-tRNA(Gln) amidotransferase subunit A
MDAPASPTITATDLADLGVLDAVSLLRSREVSSGELVAALQARIDAVDGPMTPDGAPDAINAWVRRYPELAAEQAAAADRRLADEGQRAPLLCGVPIGLKDLYAVEGLPVTASSRAMDGTPAPASCTVWRRLQAAGMVPLGHLHTHEFAAGATTDQVGNPWDRARTAGGSSGGSGAALAARLVPAATGTDTAGSLRIPASLCGISTVKATRGRVPIDGIVPLAATFDHAGPMARSVADCTALLIAMADGGPDVLAQGPPAAPMAPLPVGPRAGERPMAGITVALTDRYDAGLLHPDTADGVARARTALEALGAHVVERPAPMPGLSVTSPEIAPVLFADVAVAHRHRAHRLDDYRAAVRGFVEQASEAITVDRYVEGQAFRDRAAATWDAWMEAQGVELVLEATTTMPAILRGAGGEEVGDGLVYAELTVQWDATGHPVVALPAGLGPRTGLPVGVSLVAPRGRESVALQAGIDLQAGPLPPLTMPM